MADVNGLVQGFMQGSPSIHRINSTHVVLIPKVPNLEFIGQFQPISLCNYFYKILSKVLVNRLRLLLPELISRSHNAFVSGR